MTTCTPSKLVFPGRLNFEMFANLQRGFNSYEIAGQEFVVVQVSDITDMTGSQYTEIDLVPVYQSLKVAEPDSIMLQELTDLGISLEDTECSPWDVAEFLNTKESILAYLSVAMNYGEVDYFTAALEAANRAYKGMVETK